MPNSLNGLMVWSYSDFKQLSFLLKKQYNLTDSIVLFELLFTVLRYTFSAFSLFVGTHFLIGEMYVKIYLFKWNKIRIFVISFLR